MQKTTASLEQPGPTGRRLLTQAETVQRRSRAINVAAVVAAGPGRLSMSHIRNTNRIESSDSIQATSIKLDRSSSMGYYRTNGEVQHRSRFVGRIHITNRRHAHLVRSSMRAARKYPGLPVDSNVLMVMERPGDRETPVTCFKPQAASLKPQVSSFKRLNY